MKKYILAIDQGTTSSRAILFDKEGKPICSAQREINVFYPASGHVEQDPIEIYISVVDVINEVLIKANLSYENIDSIGITNQRETTVVFDKKTGLPIYNAVVWQSRQSQSICENVSEKDKDIIRKKTGLLINPYFSGSKIRYILDKTNKQKDAEDGKLSFGTIDTWLIYKLTNGKVFATDYSNASRTMLYNIHTLQWDDELLKIFNIPRVMLPSVYPSSHYYGNAAFFGNQIEVPICGVAGDQQASLFGQTCFEKGDIKNTYGTGCFMLMNTGEQIIESKNGLLATIAWGIGDKITYALEGSVFVGGASVQWLRDQMKLIPSADKSEESALKVSDSDGVYVVPAFVGLGTPYWDDDARGAVFGLTRATTKYHFIRATLESIAFQSKDVMEVMKKETGMTFKRINVDGGATKNKYLMQFQADICNLELKLPKCLETTALGVSYLAGLCSGFYESMESIKKIHEYQAIYEPKMKKSEINIRYKKWKKAIKATRVFK